MRLLPALLALIIASCGGAPAHAGTSVAAGDYPVQSVRVIDGDTPEVRIGLVAGMPERFSVRFAKVNAAESGLGEAKKVCARGGAAGAACEQSAGVKAKAWATEWVRGKACVVRVTGIGFQGRYTGDLICDGVAWTDAGLSAGHLQRSDKKRVPWCGVENAR